jgi:hypothetical protein
MGIGIRELIVILLIVLLVWGVKTLRRIGEDLGGAVRITWRRPRSRPPAVMECIVRLLVPPASREHVMGDLAERHVAPRRHYLADALHTVPFVIASCVRRTCNLPYMGILAILVWFGVFYGSLQSSWWVAAIPTFLTIAALVLRDAYRTLTPKWPREAAVDVATVAAVVLIFEASTALVAPHLQLSRRALLVGFPIGCIMLFFVRLHSPGRIHWSRAAASTMSRTEVLAEVRGLETDWRRALRLEIGAAVVVVAGIAARLWAAPQLSMTLGAGSALLAAGALFVAWFLHTRARVESIPEELEFAQLLAFYAQALERRSELSRSFLWWYVLPLAVGPAVLATGQALQQPQPVLAIVKGSAVLVVIGALLVQLKRGAARTFQHRIAQLATVSEKQQA